MPADDITTRYVPEGHLGSSTPTGRSPGSTPMPDNLTPVGDRRLTVVFAADAHESFEDFLIERAAAGYYTRLDGSAVHLHGYQGGHLHYHRISDDNEPIGDPQRLPLRDSHGLLTVTHIEIL